MNDLNKMLYDVVFKPDGSKPVAGVDFAAALAAAHALNSSHCGPWPFAVAVAGSKES